MGKIPPFKREAMFSLYEVPLYDETATRELLMAVGPPSEGSAKVEVIAHALNEIGKAFAFELYHEVQASTPEREKEAERLAKACDKVLEIVGLKDGGDLFPMFANGGLFASANLRGEPKGEAATMNALRAVDLLRQDALKMVEIMGKRRGMKAPAAGNPGSPAMRKMIRDLSCLYETVWERSPGISSGETLPSGPFMRLMLDVVKRLRSRGLRFSASEHSLRRAWQRLDNDEKMPLTVISAKFKALENSKPRTA